MDIKDIIRIRKSCRSYDGTALTREEKEVIKEYAKGLKTPFGSKLAIYFLEAEKGVKLSTYGVIKGTDSYLGVSVLDGPMAMFDVGYTFEKVILKATEMGLGTCWLAGTFNRKQFRKMMDLKEGEIFPIITPIGSPAEKLRTIDKLFRKSAGSDHRIAYEELFFDESFDTPMTEHMEALEMVRLAPSAVNRQPWRVVRCGDVFHFYKKGKPLADKLLDLDVGIAACHFDMVMGGGVFNVEEPGIQMPKDMAYLFTWKEAEEISHGTL